MNNKKLLAMALMVMGSANAMNAKSNEAFRKLMMKAQEVPSHDVEEEFERESSVHEEAQYDIQDHRSHVDRKEEKKDLRKPKRMDTRMDTAFREFREQMMKAQNKDKRVEQEAQIQQLERRDDYQDPPQDLLDDLSEYKSRVEELSNKISEYEDGQNALSREIDVHKKQIESHKKQIDTHKKQIESHKKREKNLLDEIASYRKKLSNKREGHETLRKTLAGLKKGEDFDTNFANLQKLAGDASKKRIATDKALERVKGYGGSIPRLEKLHPQLFEERFSGDMQSISKANAGFNPKDAFGYESDENEIVKGDEYITENIDSAFKEPANSFDLEAQLWNILKAIQENNSINEWDLEVYGKFVDGVKERPAYKNGDTNHKKVVDTFVEVIGNARGKKLGQIRGEK